MKLNSFSKNGLHGVISVPGDKSISHRGLILGALSSGTTQLHHFLAADDCLSTLNALKDLGVPITRKNDFVTIEGQGLTGLKRPTKSLDMGNAGTATRLLAGLLAGQSFTSTLIGDSSLSKRPMGRVQTPLQEMGAKIELTDGHLPMTITGQKLHSIDYQMTVASAQVKSALIFAALQADEKSTIKEFLPTRDHTERLLNKFGASITTSDDGYTITVDPHPHLVGQDLTIPGDMSSAAFFITAASIIPNSKITILNVGINPTRTGLLNILEKMGGKVKITNRSQTDGEPTADLEIESAQLKPIKITSKDIPDVIDELPLVALLAAAANGVSEVTGALELRVKETDRISTIVTELQKLGIKITELTDGFIIDGRDEWQIKNSKLDSHGDHRIGMMLAIAALRIKEPLALENEDAISISYPQFFEDLKEIEDADSN
ncbi:3-phosphoshikimate 1-carboxyvinyltransferase [Xylocopilactobacillus apicola]|uniref:3-phosphoshikimate 1-carboxyvinyltransferase n=1 Tax=Xylocopilactobacillus apicola TaxID=2932184 RepID=A0AAU9DEA0_9LACO|nr:3-phosphoshikimate 1-carboxyvinyltransferase [Xylocopilactobacillus apicola]BDR59192.1 3-phosphoshikimate 1-carboxyvinyltransferase [Xylocopilactobacillus apicola]